MGKSLAQLKKEKAQLLKKLGLKKASLESIRKEEAEKRKLEAEIKALKNPGSAVARERAKKSAIKLGRFLKQTAGTVSNNAVRLRREREARKREERQLEIERLKAVRRRAAKRKKKK